MNETLLTMLSNWLGPLAAGVGLGAVFFGGLWLTLRRLPDAAQPWLLIVASLIVRTSVVLFGFWYFTQGEPFSIFGVLIGFIAVQMLPTYHQAFGRNPSRTQRRNPSA